MTQTPKEIAEWIVYEVGAMLHESSEAQAMVRAITRAIRAERRNAVSLTRAEIDAALQAMSQMTWGNGHDFDEWQRNTSASKHEWNALLRAEKKLAEANRMEGSLMAKGRNDDYN